MKKTILVLAIGGLAIASCKKKGCMEPLAQNYNAEAKKDDGTCSYEIAEPTTYAFSRDGSSSVSFSGQTTRFEMLSEMVTYMKSANTAGTAVSATTLEAMYANDGQAWTDAPGLGMTGSTKQLKNKTAFATAGGSADAAVQSMFEGYMDDLATLSSSTVTETGESGTAGVWPNDGQKGPYLMGADGREYTQLIEKGLMCAVFMGQITVNYLGTVGDDDNSVLEEGKNYTEMEHHWDEAFGYFTDAIDYPSNGTDRFWGKYANGRESVISSASNIYNAFKLGRKAIVSKDYATRDAQITVIRDEMEKVCAGTAIHYLNSAKSKISYNTARNHSLSEAEAFLNGLKYGYNTISGNGISSLNIDAALAHFSDYNTVTLDDLDDAIDAIAANTGLESVKGSL
jgi:hypothetical protein